MTSAEARIDELYQAPLDSFTPQRNALAKSLGGSEAARVRQLRKPTVVAWAINQLYWRERALFDRIRKTGEKLRGAQLAALKSGHRADLRTATDAHRKALADAVAAASRLAATGGVHPPADALGRTLEALSLTATMSEPPGRLTEPLQPAGFEALTGVPIAATAARHHEPSSAHGPSHERRMGDERGEEAEPTVRGRSRLRSSPGKAATAAPGSSAAQRRQEKAARAVERRRIEAAARHERELAAAARSRQAALARAEAALARARAHEGRAREAWERARREMDEAARAVAALRDR